MQEFDILKFLDKKRKNLSLTEKEIFDFVDNVKLKKLPDYQITAFLMASAINGLSDQEITWLTIAMAQSGVVYEVPNKEGRIFIDKHSSGGVGDKTSIALFPILACGGLYILKASGRGLGFTGGTIDKLQSIGMNVDFDFNEALKIVEKSRVMITSQTDFVAPVDRTLYKLRDVTSTAESIPLIASSIMSKKIAFKVDYLFLDIKYGTGAFCKTLNEAKELAKIMQTIGKLSNLKTFIHISSMQQPLGNAIGNAIEILEVHKFLLGESISRDLKEFIISFAVDIFVSTGIFSSKEIAKNKVEEFLITKQALKACEKWFRTQGADMNKWENRSYFNPKYKYEVLAKKEGYFSIKNNEKIGIISSKLGASRIKADDEIDYQAGIWIHKKINDRVNKGEVIYTLYSSRSIDLSLEQEIMDNTIFSEEKVIEDELIIEYVE